MELLHSNKLSGGDSGASTQKYVDVMEVRDGVIVLKNGTLRSVLMVSSINFDLKSSEEQDAIISQYQDFLNSLDFPVQILITSRKLNIEPYIDILKQKEIQQVNELLRLQVSEYQKFIKNLTDVSNIMAKSFYIIVPFAPVESTSTGMFSKISAVLHPKKVIEEKKEFFETYKDQLWQRVEHIITALGGSGVKIVALKTEEVIEFLYNSYSPKIESGISMKSVEGIDLTK